MSQLNGLALQFLGAGGRGPQHGEAKFIPIAFKEHGSLMRPIEKGMASRYDCR